MLVPGSTVSISFKIDHLSPFLKGALMAGNLTFTQARAFATFPNPEAQDALYHQLEELAEDPGILRAIKRGDTVLELADDFMILPSRKPLREIGTDIAA